MSKRIVGLLAGVAAASLALSVSPIAAASTSLPTSSTKPAPKPAPAPKVVRQVHLSVPRLVSVGDSYSGYVQVVDVDGKLVLPVPGAYVSVQVQRPRSSFVEVTSGTTDDGGVLSFSAAAQTNVSWRAVVRTGGKTLLSRPATTAASLGVSWGARPDMDVTHGVASVYTARVFPAQGAFHFDYAAATARPRWVPTKRVSVPLNGLVSSRIAFPRAGTYLLRGSVAGSATNAPGYTSTIRIVVH